MQSRKALYLGLVFMLAGVLAWWMSGQDGGPVDPQDLRDSETTIDGGSAPARSEQGGTEASTTLRDLAPLRDGATPFVIRVRDGRDRSPIADARVTIYQDLEIKSPTAGLFRVRVFDDSAKRKMHFRGRTDAKGELAAPALTLGDRYTVAVDAKGHVDVLKPVRWNAARAARGNRFDIELYRQGSLKVTVLNPDGSTLQGAKIRVRPARLDVRRNLAFHRADTNAHGVAMIPSVPSGKWHVEIFRARTKDHWVDASPPGFSPMLESRVVDIRANEITTVRVKLASLTKLKIRVVARGRPVTNGRVAMRTTKNATSNPFDVLTRAIPGTRYSASKSLDAKGEVTFRAVRGGNRTIEVRVGDRGVPHFFDLEVDEQAELVEHTIQLHPARLTITIEGDDTDLERATVEVAHERSTLPTTIAIGQKRRIEIEHLCPGEYRISLRGPRIFEVPPQTVKLPDEGDVKATLRVPDVVPVHVRVHGSPSVATLRWRRNTDEKGGTKYLRRGRGTVELAPGTWLLDVRGPGTREYGPLRSVELRVGFPREIELATR